MTVIALPTLAVVGLVWFLLLPVIGALGAKTQSRSTSQELRWLIKVSAFALLIVPLILAVRSWFVLVLIALGAAMLVGERPRN